MGRGKHFLSLIMYVVLKKNHHDIRITSRNLFVCSVCFRVLMLMSQWYQPVITWFPIWQQYVGGRKITYFQKFRLKLRVFLADHVAMLTNFVTKMVTTCSSMTWNFWYHDCSINWWRVVTITHQKSRKCFELPWWFPCSPPCSDEGLMLEKSASQSGYDQEDG